MKEGERLKVLIPDGELRSEVRGFMYSAGLRFAGRPSQYLHSGQ